MLAAPLAFGAGAGPGRRGGPGPFGPAPPGALAVSGVHLSLAELARSPLAVAAAGIGQTAAMLALIVAWLLVLAGRPKRPRAGRPSDDPADLDCDPDV